MEKKFKIWELALMMGLLIGLLGGPAEAATLPVSRWQAGAGEILYQVNLFPFGFAQAGEPITVWIPEQPDAEYEIGFRVLEWWQERFG